MSGAAKHEELRNTVGKALGRVPSGVFVLTASDTDRHRRYAMLASWVQQAAFDPPAVCLAIGKDRPMRETILRTRRFALSVLGDGDKELMRRYARPRGPDDDPLTDADTFAAPSGIPAITGALAWLDCELIQTCDFGGDHELIIARVTAGNVLRAGHSFTHVRGNGFHY